MWLCTALRLGCKDVAYGLFHPYAYHACRLHMRVPRYAPTRQANLYINFPRNIHIHADPTRIFPGIRLQHFQILYEFSHPVMVSSLHTTMHVDCTQNSQLYAYDACRFHMHYLIAGRISESSSLKQAVRRALGGYAITGLVSLRKKLSVSGMIPMNMSCSCCSPVAPMPEHIETHTFTYRHPETQNVKYLWVVGLEIVQCVSEVSSQITLHLWVTVFTKSALSAGDCLYKTCIICRWLSSQSLHDLLGTVFTNSAWFAANPLH